MQSSILAAALVLTMVQPGAQSFACTWTGNLDGQLYAQLELRTTNDDISGRISLGGVHFGSNGSVEAVMHPATTFTPIFDVVLRDGVLSFARNDNGDIDRFEMRLTNGEGRLTLLLRAEDRVELASQGIATLEPLRLMRASR
jgi:hypothetical protein